MCEHRECEHSLGPSSHCSECDRLERMKMTRKCIHKIEVGYRCWMCPGAIAVPIAINPQNNP
jgi:hypothetical protein